MSEFTIPGAVITEATKGAVNKKMLINWADRELWLTQIQPAERGKVRLYSYANALEACLASAMSAVGLSRGDIKNVIAYRGALFLWVSPDCVAGNGEWLLKLPEWNHDTAYWAIRSCGVAQRLQFTANLGSFSSTFADADGLQIVNVGVIKRRLDDLIEAGMAAALKPGPQLVKGSAQ